MHYLKKKEKMEIIIKNKIMKLIKQKRNYKIRGIFIFRSIQ